ncbi:hypothetical protein [Maridesulfovibrio sp.]|uniref:hypothetical protein n=1 Tax=Maridesulfovibrio sp. TaxID=2795000 RepID=UPI002A18B321|nr:hypothetical protein [Maridesulfovibrio sp.]
MAGAKDSAFDYSLGRLFKYGPADVALGMVGGSLGMLQGLGGAILGQDKPQNEAADKAEEIFRNHRDKITDGYFDKFKNNYRK